MERGRRRKRGNAQARAKEKAHGEEGAKKRVAHKFAKMSVAELEKAIGKIEEDLAGLEAAFGNPRVAANVQAMRELQAKYARQKGLGRTYGGMGDQGRGGEVRD